MDRASEVGLPRHWGESEGEEEEDEKEEEEERRVGKRKTKNAERESERERSRESGSQESKCYICVVVGAACLHQAISIPRIPFPFPFMDWWGSVLPRLPPR